MIHDILIIHRENEIPLYHSVSSGQSKLTAMGLDSNLYGQLAVTIVRALRGAGALEQLRLREAKLAFLVYENLIFSIVTSHDHDEFEINHALERFSSLFLQSYTPEVIEQYKNQPLSFNGMDSSSIFRSDRVVISDIDSLMKSMIQRLADMIQVANRLGLDADMLKEKQNLDGTVVLSINAMQQELTRRLQTLKSKMDQLPVMSGPDFPG